MGSRALRNGGAAEQGKRVQRKGKIPEPLSVDVARGGECDLGGGGAQKKEGRGERGWSRRARTRVLKSLGGV